MDVIGVKVLAGLLFFVLAIFFGWMPFWLMRRCVTRTGNVLGPGHKKSDIVQYLHSMASGVLVATCLLHLLPESLSDVRKAAFISGEGSKNYHGDKANDTTVHNSAAALEQEGTTDDNYPVAELLVALGFLFMCIIDSTVKSMNNSRNKISDSNEDDDIFLRSLQRNADKYDLTDCTEKRHGIKLNARLSLTSGDDSRLAKWSKPIFLPVASEDGNVREEDEVVPLYSRTGSLSDNELHGSDVPSDRDVPAGHRTLLSQEVHSLASFPNTRAASTSDHLRSVALVTSLCIHGFFDGIMLGLQTSKSVLMSLLLALSLHKSFVAISLSLTLLHGYNKRTTRSSRILLCVVLFAVVAPVGLAMSAAFVHTTFDLSSSRRVSIIPGAMQSFAVGTFMYVTFTETTQHHGEERSLVSGLVHSVLLVVGFALMAALRLALGPT